MAAWIPWNLALSLLPAAATDFVRDEAERQRLREELLRSAQDYSKLLLLWAGRVAQIVAGISFLFATATVLYGMLYFLLIPSRFHEQQIFFDYGPRHAALTEHITTPSAMLNLLDPVHQWHSAYTPETRTQETVLVPGVKYDVIVELTVPESRVNAELGVFMVATTLRSQNAASKKHTPQANHPSEVARSHQLKGEYLASSTRPVTLHDLPAPVRWLRLAAMLAPYTLGFSEPAQTLDVMAINGYTESGERPLTQVEVELNTPSLQVYSAKLTIIAQLTGVRYLMYHWSVPTAILVILNLVFIEALALVILYAFYALPQPEEAADGAAQREAAAARAKAKQLFEEKSSTSSVATSSLSGEVKSKTVDGDAKTENAINAVPFTAAKQEPAAPVPSAPPAPEEDDGLLQVKHEAVSDDEVVEVKQEVVDAAAPTSAVGKS